MVRTLMAWAPRLSRPLAKLEREIFDRFVGPNEEWWPMMERFSPRTNVAETDTAM